MAVEVFIHVNRSTIRYPSTIMTIAVHPYIHGVPHRIKYFRKIFKELSEKPGVVFMTGAEILDWYLAQQ